MERKPRVIAFEGVDGSGKSTVVRLVASWLRKRGVPVFLPRSGKEHDSRPTRMIRRLTRDRRNLSLGPRSELQLYCAREAQILDELVTPALGRGETVLLDRGLLTPLVLGHWGRSLPMEDCEAATRVAAAGREPDLTLIFDVHPRTSRIRKRIEKIRNHRSRDGGRKGLAGTALKERIRDGYLAVANAKGYPLFHVERATPEELAERVIKVLEGGPVEGAPEDALPTWQVDPALTLADALELQSIPVALYMTRGLIFGRPLRAKGFEIEPQLVASGLDREDPLRARAVEVEPLYALSGWQRRPLDADDLRARVPVEHLEAGLRGLKGVEGEAADALRTAGVDQAPGAVCESLRNREDQWAVELRAATWEAADSYQRAESLIGCVGEDATSRREALFDRDPVAGLVSLRGVSDGGANRWLYKWADRAPKAVLGALVGRDDDVAHGLREALVQTGREAIDSLRGVDHPRAWALRLQMVERWPSTVLWSVAGTAASPSRDRVVAACCAHGPGDLHYLRRQQGLEEHATWPAWALAEDS